MQASQWRATTEISLMALLSPDALGVTNYWDTWINTDAITAVANDMGVPSDYMVATVMVHEFDHAVHDRGKPDTMAAEHRAFGRSTQFAHKLPEPYGSLIAAKSDEDDPQNGNTSYNLAR